MPIHNDITCDPAAKGVFPAAMLQDGACRTGVTASYPRSPWGSAVTIYAPWADDFGPSDRAFQIDF